MNYRVDNSDKNVNINHVEKAIKNLNNVKDDIEGIIDKWDIAKKSTHNYEYVYTSYNSIKNIADKRPISRSYFKLVEILNKFNGDKTLDNALCLAEAPGGFIEALMDRGMVDIYGITLLSDDKSIPYWNQRLLDNDNIKLLLGVKGNGDLYDVENILSFVKVIKRDMVEIITGDGGIDYSDDYNSQEKNSIHIIYSEILIALLMQKEGGMFICKIFDVYDIKTVKLLYILYNNYEEVYIYKPCISRLTNSEKYIVCKGARSEKKYINEMLRNFENKEIDIELPTEFTNCIYNISIEYIDIQIKNINETIDVARKNKMKSSFHTQRTYASEWCNDNNIKIRKQRS
jgi:23S rRNA U2552 (ribose-2'-O)-methylase RlmE/FtsJ